LGLAKMNKKSFICGNWKLNHSLSQTKQILGEISSRLTRLEAVDIAIAPVATCLAAANEQVSGSPVKIAAQNVFYEVKGAFTGEWSVGHLTELGCKYAIIGHSERRQFFGEFDESVAKKARACLDGGLTPIVCIGESLKERQDGHTKEIIKKQLSAVLKVLVAPELSKVVLAYEPVWAIGTGQSATPSQAQEVHSFMRDLMRDCFGQSASAYVRILYGGSVRPDTIAELMSEDDVDGALVGGASLEADSFCQIVEKVA